ncbi:hypothetical protein, partial [Methylobacterium isbiliense]
MIGTRMPQEVWSLCRVIGWTTEERSEKSGYSDFGVELHDDQRKALRSRYPLHPGIVLRNL